MTSFAAKKWIITGPREVGKTRFCQNLLQQARFRNLEAAGILCPPVFENQVKTAINICDIRTSEIRPLARLRNNEELAFHNLRWIFDESVVAWGNDMLRFSTPCELLFVDELGPLEFEKNSGWQAGISAITRGQYQAAVIVIRPELLHHGIAHWPDAEVILIPPQMPAGIEKTFQDKILKPLEDHP